MMPHSHQDTLFAQSQNHLVDFAFNEAVAEVFPDMLRRSIPGYETLIAQLGVIAGRYVQANSQVYDLGCSLGAATLAIQRCVSEENVRFIAVDNAQAMVDRCEKHLAKHMPTEQFELHCANIEDIRLENASMVVLNFTLQFLAPEQRLPLLRRIYQALDVGGVLVLSEKLVHSCVEEAKLQLALYDDFKRANGYSDLEISQKRTALEAVLIPDTLEEHQQRLQQAGFARSFQWFQSFNFASFLAFK